jgi:hypothetical protein
MIDTWLNGVEELLVRTPGGLARWSEPSLAQAKVGRVFFELREADDDLAKLRPYFVVQEDQLAFERDLATAEVLEPVGSVEVLYTEMLSDPNDRKASKLSFVKFVGDMVTAIGEQQGKPIAGDTQTSHIPIERIQFSQLPASGELGQEDPDVPGTMFFWTKFVLSIG